MLRLSRILCYLEYYDFRSYGEFSKVQVKEKPEPLFQEQLPQLKTIIREELVTIINESKKKKISVKSEEKVVTQKIEQNAQPQAALNLSVSHQEPTNQGASQNLKVSSATPKPVKTKDVIADNPEREHILVAIKKARGKINSAEYRLKKDIGKRETSEQNRLEAEQELQQLEKRLSELKNGYQVKM